LKISIITVTYNSDSTIKDTLESVANQSYSNIEHIIIDGLSKDNTLATVKKFPHVSKVISEKDKGIYDAMNKGVQLATGDVIGILMIFFSMKKHWKISWMFLKKNNQLMPFMGI
jgi:glycosyltransferase involved in cell wall biosynthesis